MPLLSVIGVEDPKIEYAIFVALATFVVVNLKGLPGVWHIRLLKGVITQFIQSKPLPKTVHKNGKIVPIDQTRLFSYLVTTHQNPPIECDYNMHKSNSTFFSDMDISRAQLLLHLFGGFPRWKQPDTGVEKSLNIALGGVSCVFKREIRPFQRYGLWSRVLSWDDKWVYIVSYFVKGGMGGRVLKSGNQQENMEMEKAILASAVSRYVIKDGRKTVRPEDVLIYMGLYSQEGAQKEKIAKQKQRGLEAVRFFNGLDGLPSHFGDSGSSVLGRFADL